MVQQLAAYHGIYVVYTSLAHGGSVFPGRSPVADKTPRDVSMDPLEEFWKIFTMASLTEVEACKMVGITPAGYNNLQAKEEYLPYQTDFADRVDDLSKKYRKLDETQSATNILNDVKEYLSSHREGSQGPMLAWHGELKGNDDNRGPVMAERIGKRWIPKTFLYFDEARELIDYEESQLFHSLRHALEPALKR